MSNDCVNTSKPMPDGDVISNNKFSTFRKSIEDQISRLQASRPLNTESLLQQASEFDVGPRIVSDTLDPYECALIKRKEAKLMKAEEEESRAVVVRDPMVDKPKENVSDMNPGSTISKEMVIENLHQNLRKAAGQRSNPLTPPVNISIPGNRSMIYDPSVLAYMKSMEELKQNTNCYVAPSKNNGESGHPDVVEIPAESTSRIQPSNESTMKSSAGTAAPLSFQNQTSPPMMNISQKINGNKRGRPKRDPREGWPKRPLSAYNIFFKDIRQEIVGSEEDTPMYDSFGNSLKPHSRRRRRKKHGKISFGGLAKAVGAMWKKLPADKVAFYEARAEESREAYRKEIQLFLQKRSAAQRGHHI